MGAVHARGSFGETDAMGVPLARTLLWSMENAKVVMKQPLRGQGHGPAHPVAKYHAVATVLVDPTQILTVEFQLSAP
jgi:hypothetical protein